MKKLLCLLFIAGTFASCDKDNDLTCVERMKAMYESELKCTIKGSMEVNLYSGTYKGKSVYFTNIVCIACNAAPPAFGYNCNKEKITFDTFTNVTKVREVYNSCTKKYV